MIREILFKLFDVEESPCQSCETLKRQLEVVNYEKAQILERLLNKIAPVEVQSAKPEEMRELKPKTIPWAVRKEMLEAEDRRKAQLMRETRDKIDKLESEVGISELNLKEL